MTVVGYNRARMHPPRRLVIVNLKPALLAGAVALDDTAAWNCPCGDKQPLIGRTGQPEHPREEVVIVCPSCGRRFWVHCAEPNGRALGVAEL